jgi:hypothetical protein
MVHLFYMVVDASMDLLPPRASVAAAKPLGHFRHFFGAMAFGAPHAPFGTAHAAFGSAHAPSKRMAGPQDTSCGVSVCYGDISHHSCGVRRRSHRVCARSHRVCARSHRVCVRLRRVCARSRRERAASRAKTNYPHATCVVPRLAFDRAEIVYRRAAMALVGTSLACDFTRGASSPAAMCFDPCLVANLGVEMRFKGAAMPFGRPRVAFTR